MKDRGAATSACVLIAWLCAIPCAWPGRAGAEEPAPPAAAAGEAGDQGDDPLIGEKRLSELLVQLRHQNKGIQLRAAKALIEAPAELRPKMMPKMMPLLKSERENDKYVAAFILGECGPAARAAVPDLLPMLEGTQYERNRAAAAKALGLILKDAKPSEEVEKVSAALTRRFNEDYDKYADVRRESVRALGMIGPAAKSCIPRLTRGLTDFQKWSEQHRQVRRQAAWTCGRMGPLAAEHVDRLISMMQSEGEWAPEYVEALGLIGPVNENVAKNIVDKMEAADGNAEGLAVRDPAERFRVKGFAALARFGPKAECAVSFTKRFLSRRPRSNDAYGVLMATEAVRMLGAVGPKAKEALPEVEALTTFDASNELGKALREEAVKAAAALKGENPAPKTDQGGGKS
jgi:hypothetical protein